jgi:hypothetical protein
MTTRKKKLGTRTKNLLWSKSRAEKILPLHINERVIGIGGDRDETFRYG